MTAYLPARPLADGAAEIELLDAAVAGRYLTYPTPSEAADRIRASGRELGQWGVYAIEEVRPGAGGGGAARPTADHGDARLIADLDALLTSALDLAADATTAVGDAPAGPGASNVSVYADLVRRLTAVREESGRAAPSTFKWWKKATR